jgi:fructose-1,6-bisphosphatase
MSQEEQFEKMRLEILGNSADRSKDDIFKSKLDDAEIVALNTLYPYDLTKTSLNVDKNKRLANWQTRCAIELYSATSRLGISSYSENGMSATFLSSLVSSDLKNELRPPKAGIPK